MSRLFRQNGITAESVLPIGQMKLFSDLGSAAFCPERMDHVLKRAEEMLGKEIPFCPASFYIEFAENGNRTDYEAPYFARRDMAFTLAIAEAYEKKGRFTRKLMDALWAIMEESTWVLPAHMFCFPTHGDLKLPAVFGEDRTQGVDLFSAATAATLAIVHHLCRDALDEITPVICEKLRRLVKKDQLVPFLTCDFGWTGANGSRVNNWNPWIISNILTAAALIEDDLYVRKAIVAKALNCLDNYTVSISPDGGCDEGPDYWWQAGVTYFTCLEILSDMTGGKIDLFGHPEVKAMCDYYVRVRIDGDYFINFADAMPHVTSSGEQLIRMGEKTGSEALLSFGRSLPAYQPDSFCSTSPYRELRVYMTPMSEGGGKTVGFRKVWFPAMKVMAFRESELTDRGFFLSMKGGNNDESHNHNDIGNVLVYYDGKPVLIDVGAGTYTKKTFSEFRYDHWYINSDGHNVASVGGFLQSAGREFRSSDEVYDEENGGLSLELREAYPAQAGILSYRRSAVCENGRIILRDVFALDGEKEIDLHFMTPEKPVADGNSFRLAEGRTLRFDPRLTASAEEITLGDPKIERGWDGRKSLWRIRLKAAVRDAEFVTVIE